MTFLRRLPAGARIGLPVIGFGALVLALVLAANGSGFPAAGTPIVDIAATNAVRTLDAANALLPIPAVTATAQARLRAAWTVDSTPGRVDALLLAGGTVYVGGAAGLFAAGAGDVLQAVPPESAPEGLSQAEGRWVSAAAPMTLPDPVAAMCPDGLRGAAAAGEASIWLVCGDDLLHATRERRFWFQAAVGPDEGLPGAPSGALLVDPAGRVWIGLADGLAILAPPPEV